MWQLSRAAGFGGSCPLPSLIRYASLFRCPFAVGGRSCAALPSFVFRKGIQAVLVFPIIQARPVFMVLRALLAIGRLLIFTDAALEHDLEAPFSAVGVALQASAGTGGSTPHGERSDFRRTIRKERRRRVELSAPRQPPATINVIGNTTTTGHRAITGFTAIRAGSPRSDRQLLTVYCR